MCHVRVSPDLRERPQVLHMCQGSVRPWRCRMQRAAEFAEAGGGDCVNCTDID